MSVLNAGEHACFDPDSSYSRMRVNPGEAVKGFFEYLTWKANPPERPLASRTAKKSEFVESSRPGAWTLSATTPRFLVVASGDVNHCFQAKSKREERPTLDFGFWVKSENLPPDTKCRLLIVEPDMVTRLREAMTKPVGQVRAVVSDEEPAIPRGEVEQLLRRALDDETLRENVEVARLLSALPAIDSSTNAQGRAEFVVDAPKGTPNLPRETYVVVLLDYTPD